MADNQTLNLINGYIRLLERIKQIIPTAIIELIIRFFHLELTIIYLQQRNGGATAPLIHIAALGNNTHSKSMLKPSSEADANASHYINRLTSVSVCVVNNFALPKNIASSFNLNPNHLYDTIFLLGGGDYGNECTVYSINRLKMATDDIYAINGYYWKLPTATPYVLDRCSTIYSQKYGLICIGEYFNILRFDTEMLKWDLQQHNTKTKRRRSSTVMIADDKLLCCGGFEYWRICNDENNVNADMYDFKCKQWTKIANMNMGRYGSGICFDDLLNPTVYVGGGMDDNDKPTKTFEYYDITNNKWYLLPDTNGEHSSSAIIWNTDINIINIASTIGEMFESMDKRENKWTIYMKTDSICKLFGFDNLTKRDYNSCFSLDKGIASNRSRLVNNILPR